MIKYLELTAPVQNIFRQAKILSIECKEGEKVQEGTTLFKVQSGENTVELPSTKDGRVFEIIANVGENITVSSALLLLETNTETSTATAPIIPVEEQTYYRVPFSVTQPPVRPKPPKRHLVKAKPEANDPKIERPKVVIDIEKEKEHVAESVEPSTALNDSIEVKSKITELEPQQSLSPVEGIAQEADLYTQTLKKTIKRQSVKKHQQQSLNLDGEHEPKNIKPITLDEIPSDIKGASSVNKPQKPDVEMSNTMPASSTTQITVPDIGADSAKVIELLVNVGDSVAIEDSIVTLESDKASMDVPSSHAGVVSAISVSIGEDVSEGTVLIEISSSDANESAPHSKETVDLSPADEEEKETSAEPVLTQTVPMSELNNSLFEITIPDIGGDSAKVIEVLVNVGDSVEIEDALVTLESDKASMDVPSSAKGIIKSINVNIDDTVSEGTIVATVLSHSIVDAPSPKQDAPKQAAPVETTPTPSTNHSVSTKPASSAPTQTTGAPKNASKSHASPSIRRFARELGVDISKVNGSGRKARITRGDVAGFVKTAMTSPVSTTAAGSITTGTGIPPIPAQDFTKFGEIDVQPLNKIKRLTASNLHRSWVNVPHVTHNDESNISDLESFRKQLNGEYAKQNKNIKLSPLAFIVKAVVNAMQMYPQFNSSLEPGGENLIYKKYFNIGIAVETPNGLVVPVIKGADTMSVAEIAQEMGDLAKKARDKKLTMADMSGACITISSLGGIGGTHFTPIVNAPEVAILGVSRNKIQPVWNGSEFIPGTMLPLSLSYDHRVIDGAEAARFTRHIAAVLEDVRRLTV